MKVLLVLTLDVEDPEHLPRIIDHIAPSTIPAFKGPLRVVVEPTATAVERWLDK